MRVLYLDWPCYGTEDTINALNEMGHEVIRFSHSDYNHMESPAFLQAFDKFVGDTAYDFCFSYNYFPLLSNACNAHNIKYVSVTYDSPYVFLYSPTILNPVNYVFVFDSKECDTLRAGGLSNIYYIPLPVHACSNPELLRSGKKAQQFSSEISFVGSLYNETHNLFERLNGISDYTRGYLMGIMNAQLQIQGYNFLEEVLTDEILEDINKVIPYDRIRNGAEPPEYLYANYFLARKLTSMERTQLLSLAAQLAPLDLYTWNKDAMIPQAKNRGSVDYKKEMPYVFANSKINLNITLRSIKTGVPLRALDIMASGGFLLSSFQSDFLEYLIPDEDFVYFESKEDFVNKIHFYLTHEEIRKEIAMNGYEKVKEFYNHFRFFERIFEVVFPFN